MLAIGVYIAVLGGGLALVHGDTTARPFVLLGIGVMGLVTIARLWSRGRARSFGRPLACAIGVVAVAFLALEVSDPALLDRFGL